VAAMFIFGESSGSREAVLPPVINVEHRNTLMSSLILIRREMMDSTILAYFAFRLASYLHKLCKLAQVACKLGASDRSQGFKAFLAKT
jgi:hypothetical protein